MRQRGAQTVIVTLGAMGVFVAADLEVFHSPVELVRVVDSSGAGDAFLGALAFYLSNMPQLSLRESVLRSSQIATMTVQKPGTQSSYPSRGDLSAALFE